MYITQSSLLFPLEGDPSRVSFVDITCEDVASCISPRAPAVLRARGFVAMNLYKSFSLLPQKLPGRMPRHSVKCSLRSHESATTGLYVVPLLFPGEFKCPERRAMSGASPYIFAQPKLSLLSGEPGR